MEHVNFQIGVHSNNNDRMKFLMNYAPR